MNLIEQLGGYERAKRIEKNIYGTGGRLIRYPSKDLDYNDDNGGVCDVELISFKANDLKKSLLEYRRANNIFEVGDKVVSIDKYSNDMIFTVAELTSKNVFTSMEFGEIAYSFVRHAKAEEIKAGRRL